MKQSTFTGIFIILSTIIYLLILEFLGEDILSKFIVGFTLSAFFIGRYSAKFPK
ncbi:MULTISPECIES: hypothetical protein [Flavobacterium]|uniref:Uncharacterized protein n=1 Tax=Flavobacterium hankyongi TaxID=1176532 RepID=A0ABP9A625_9FLAO|nr:hypothetical protein [Flavobacterium sp. N1846]